jgi:hypothetical protein
MNLDLDEESRKRQYDQLAQIREQFAQARKEYEPLRQLDEEAKIWQEFAAEYDSVRGENDKFFNFSRQFDEILAASQPDETGKKQNFLKTTYQCRYWKTQAGVDLSRLWVALKNAVLRAGDEDGYKKAMEDYTAAKTAFQNSISELRKRMPRVGLKTDSVDALEKAVLGMCEAYEKALAKYDHNDPAFGSKVDADVKGLGQNCWNQYLAVEDVVHKHIARVESLAADVQRQAMDVCRVKMDTAMDRLTKIKELWDAEVKEDGRAGDCHGLIC